jgi:hypothetical protein
MGDAARAPLARLVADGIEKIEASFEALLADAGYALLEAKRVSQMAIDVVTATELLVQAGLDPAKAALAECFVHRHMLNLDLHAKRITSGDATAWSVRHDSRPLSGGRRRRESRLDTGRTWLESPHEHRAPGVVFVRRSPRSVESAG